MAMNKGDEMSTLGGKVYKSLHQLYTNDKISNLSKFKYLQTTYDWFDPWSSQYSFQRLMIVIAT